MSEQCDIKHASGWGTGIPYTGWIVTNLLRDEAEVSVVIAEHSVNCSADHGHSSFIFADPGFAYDDAYGRLCDLGYIPQSLMQFSLFSGAGKVLDLFSTPNNDHDPICLCFDRPAGREFTDIEERREQEAFGSDPLNIPAVIGTVLGPFPRMDNISPLIDDEMLARHGARRPS